MFICVTCAHCSRSGCQPKFNDTSVIEWCADPHVWKTVDANKLDDIDVPFLAFWGERWRTLIPSHSLNRVVGHFLVISCEVLYFLICNDSLPMQFQQIINTMIVVTICEICSRSSPPPPPLHEENYKFQFRFVGFIHATPKYRNVFNSYFTAWAILFQLLWTFETEGFFI